MEQRRTAGQTPRNGLLAKLKAVAAQLKEKILALHLAAGDPRTPWYAKAVIVCVVAYAFSPIDLIPDVIPILGYLDDLVLLPLGIYVALKLIPPEILADCQAKAAMGATLPRSWYAAGFILLLWLATVVLLGYFLLEAFLPPSGLAQPINNSRLDAKGSELADPSRHSTVISYAGENRGAIPSSLTWIPFSNGMTDALRHPDAGLLPA